MDIHVVINSRSEDRATAYPLLADGVIDLTRADDLASEGDSEAGGNLAKEDHQSAVSRNAMEVVDLTGGLVSLPSILPRVFFPGLPPTSRSEPLLLGHSFRLDCSTRILPRAHWLLYVTHRSHTA
jgi:hypothetical protein